MTDRGEQARSRRRLFVFASVLGVAASVVVVQLVRLTIMLPAREGGAPLTFPEVQRGSILDRSGRILAITIRQQSVSVWTPSIANVDETASLLAQTLGLERLSVMDTFRSHDGYAVIKRRISEQEAAAISRLKADGKLAGVRMEENYGRSYPQGRLASHVVGWVGADNVPLGGIEYTLNNELGLQPVGTDPATVYGNQVVLTIDLDAQEIAERAARAAMEANKPDSLEAIVMDAHSGEILAYVSLPDFDPNELNKGVAHVDSSSLRDMSTAVAYEPGSVFKIFTISGLLDMGAIKATDTFDASGPYLKKVSSGEVIAIRDIAAHGVITPQQIIQYSSNVGAAHASDRADAASFYGMIARFGFGKQTGVPLPGETAGSLLDVSKWSARTKATIVFGQEISVSAIQMMQAATAIANDGMLLRPHIVKKIVSPEGAVLKEFSREPLSEVISPDSARTMLEWMETATLPIGTAHKAAVEGVRISAKTGTAQVIDPATRKYSEQAFIASILGIFPTDDPRYIVYVTLQNPRGQSYYGSQIAAPVFHDIALGLIDQAGIARAGTVQGSLPSTPGSASLKLVQAGGPMPDLTGTPKRVLLPLLLRQDVDVTINGSGFVVKQDPAPGTNVEKGTKIILMLQ